MRRKTSSRRWCRSQVHPPAAPAKEKAEAKHKNRHQLKQLDRAPNHSIRSRTNTNHVCGSVGGGGVAGLKSVGSLVGLGARRRERREEGDDVGAEEEDGEAQEHELDAVHRGCAAPPRSSSGGGERCREGSGVEDDDDHRKLGIFDESGRAKRCECDTGRPMLGCWRLAAIPSETTQ